LRRKVYLSILALAGILLAGCPKTKQDYKAGRKAEAIQDYDTALVDYERAVRGDPTNPEYLLRAARMRFSAGQHHVELGQRAVKKGDLPLALAEFQKAQAIDPSSSIADQEVKKTTALIDAQRMGQAPKVAPVSPNAQEFLTAPPAIKPISREPINLKMTNDARVVYETIAKLAGLSVIFDPDFTTRRITAELPNVTLEQALDAVSLESKSFWKPVTPSVIFVAPDNPQKRKDLEDEVVRTFYVSNTMTPQDLTEIVTGLRQLLDLRRVSQVNAQNAIVVRDTPDKLALAEKIIRDIDKAKPEVLLHVQVLSASLDRLRTLGVLPGQTITVAFTPRTSVQPNSSTTGTTTSSTTTSVPQITLQNLKHLSTADFSATLPGAVASAILSDNNTKIIQDPEIRVTDGQKATLKIGNRVPVATGSFQAGVGVGVGGGAGVVNPLVNTQFQYIDVGVNIDVTPRVHPDDEVSMKLTVEVSSISGTSNIGGINQPVISQRKIEHDIRLKEGEVSVLGGLIERIQTNDVSGVAGAGEVPVLNYLFAQHTKELQENDILIVITPHIIRLPTISAQNLRSLAAGTDTNVRVYREESEALPAGATAPAAVAPAQPAAQPSIAPTSAQPAAAAQLKFDPQNLSLRPGDTTTLGLSVSNVNDLYSIPLLIHYNPAVVQVEEVRNGGFLSGGTQGIAIVQRIDAEHGEVVVSATRQPNTPGVNGSGTLLGIVVRAVAPGNATLQILQVNAHDSQQRPIPMVSGEATIQVQ
jgi:general secretion pathway protein D